MDVSELARARRGEIQSDLATLLRAGMSLQREMAEIDTFLKVYDRLTEPRPSATDGQAAEYAVVTPAAAERVTAEDGHASSAPSQANAGDEATVREEVQPAPMAEVEPVSRLAAGRTADAEEAGSGPGASSAPVSPEGASEEVGGVASACSASAAGSEIPERRELDVDADAIGVPAGETAEPPERLASHLAAPGTEADEQPESAPVIRVPTVRSRVAALHAEHPEYTRREAYAALDISVGSLDGHSHALGIKWASAVPASSPVVEEEPGEGRDQRKVDGEYQETANKRNEVANLHASEPWLTPDEAAATLQMPLNNLRIFTQQFDIEWGQLPRPPAPASKVMQPTAGPTLADRVKAQHQLHPTWTARMIAQHLGEKETSVSTILAIARKETRAQVEAKPEFASKREMLQHYGDVALRLGKAK